MKFHNAIILANKTNSLYKHWFHFVCVFGIAKKGENRQRNVRVIAEINGFFVCIFDEICEAEWPPNTSCLLYHAKETVICVVANDKEWECVFLSSLVFFFHLPKPFSRQWETLFHFSAIDLTYYRVLYVFYGELFHLAVFKTDRLNWIAAATAATVNWHHMLGIGHSEWLQCFMIIVAVLNFVYFHIFLMNFHGWVWLDFLKFRSRITSLRISVSK